MGPVGAADRCRAFGPAGGAVLAGVLVVEKGLTSQWIVLPCLALAGCGLLRLWASAVSAASCR